MNLKITNTKTLITFGLVCLTLFAVVLAHNLSAPKKVAQSIAGIIYKKKVVTISNKPFTLDVSDTDNLRELGLSYRTSLAPYTGMLFVFDQPAVNPFWMKGMNFPIDIIWLDENKTVVHIEGRLDPSTYPREFGPNTPTQWVIELPSGAAESLKLSVGDKLSFDN